MRLSSSMTLSLNRVSETGQLAVPHAIKQVKARYFRGVDTCDSELVKAILAEDCVLDYRGCCTDPATGRGFFPVMNVVPRGRDSGRRLG
ncbi:MAG TPA: nuclear transport factor 2 family protein [Sphingobium sp.]